VPVTCSSLADSGSVTNSPSGSNSASARAAVDFAVPRGADEHAAERRVDRREQQRLLQRLFATSAANGTPRACAAWSDRSWLPAFLKLFAVEPDRFDPLAIIARLLPQPALHRFDEAFADPVQCGLCRWRNARVSSSNRYASATSAYWWSDSTRAVAS
jgi:hypothetical protein